MAILVHMSVIYVHTTPTRFHIFRHMSVCVCVLLCVRALRCKQSMCAARKCPAARNLGPRKRLLSCRYVTWAGSGTQPLCVSVFSDTAHVRLKRRQKLLEGAEREKIELLESTEHERPKSVRGCSKQHPPKKKEQRERVWNTCSGEVCHFLMNHVRIQQMVCRTINQGWSCEGCQRWNSIHVSLNLFFPSSGNFCLALIPLSWS